MDAFDDPKPDFVRVRWSLIRAKFVLDGVALVDGSGRSVLRHMPVLSALLRAILSWCIKHRSFSFTFLLVTICSVFVTQEKTQRLHMSDIDHSDVLYSVYISVMHVHL